MKNKKLLITSIIMMVVGIALIIAGFLDFGSVNKLKGDVTGNDTFTTSFSCEKTSLTVSEETTCILKLNAGTASISGLAGTLSVGENASIDTNNITILASGWLRLGADGYIADADHAVTGEANIISFKLTGVSVGNTTLTLVPFDGALEVYDTNLASHALTPVETTITVTDGSGGGEVDPPVTADDTLKSLTVSSGTLTPAFNKDTTSYTVSVANNVSSITINAETTDPDASLEGTGDYDLEVGQNDPISITVTSSLGSEKVYTVTVTRSADETDVAETDLSSVVINNGTLTPAFDKDITSYTITPDSNAAEIGITVTAESDTATVTGAGTKKISEITGPIEVVVVDAKGNRKVYTFTLKSASVDTECVLSSGNYGIDNTKLVVSKVDLNDSDETIASRLTATCGSFKVGDNKVVLSYGDKTKTYTIERLWVPKTGNIKVNYLAIIGGIITLMGAALFVMINVKKEKKNN